MKHQPKRWWIIISILILAAIAIAAFITTSHPKPELVTVVFVGITNDSGRKLCMFRGTNGGRHPIAYWAWPEAPDPAGWHRIGNVTGGKSDAPARQSFTFSLDAPNDSAWRLQLAYTRPLTKWAERRRACAHVFDQHKMPAMARLIFPRRALHFITGPEIHE